MRSLPVEIVRQICGHLSISDVKFIRLACKELAGIGAEHLLLEVHLVFTLPSFERLQVILLHPIISQHVTPLLYEGERLEHFKDRAEWRAHVADDHWMARKPQYP